MKRTFIALDVIPDETFLGELESIRDLLRNEKIKWVNFSRLHLTLQFLGDTDERIIPAITQKIHQSLSQKEGFNVTLTSLGVFKNLFNPRVFWIGCEAGIELTEMVIKIGDILTEFNFKGDAHDFHPHFTLGRIKEIHKKEALERLLNEFKGYEFYQFVVREIIFYESILKPEGPEYLPLTKIPLQSE